MSADPPAIDPALTLNNASDTNTDQSAAIDPALFELENLVNDVRKGKVRLDDAKSGSAGAAGGSAVPQEEAPIEDHDIDPALREIVKSLTNAQQTTTAEGESLTPAQAAAAINAHMQEHEDQEMHQSLDDITQANFGSLFPNPFPASPSTFANSLAAEDQTLALASQQPSQANQQTSEGQGESSANPLKRSRGRPKGSKNKPRPDRVRPPPKPKPPPKKRGRPLKVRTEEEIAMLEQKREEKAMGFKGKKGRPRKYPGYLVREMRLKKHKAEYRELVRRAEMGLPLDGIMPEKTGQEGEEAYQGEEEHLGNLDHQSHVGETVEHDNDMYHWPGEDDRALLEVVGVAQHMAEEHDHEGTSKQMREVFGLNDVE